MDPVEFYRLGLRLVTGGTNPDAASCRTAIGRAYYAALNRAEEILERWGASCGKGPQKHGLAVRFLQASGDPDLTLASANLDRLRSLRNRADYDMNDSTVEKPPTANMGLDLSRRVLDALADVDADPARRTAAEGQIGSYRRRTNMP